jgi:hypothetical protein
MEMAHYRATLSDEGEQTSDPGRTRPPSFTLQPRHFLALKLAIQQENQLPDLVFFSHAILNGLAGV